MKISNVLLLGGTFTLVVGSLFAIKKSKRFTTINPAYAGFPFIGAKVDYPNHMTSIIRPTHTLFLVTSGGRATLFTSPTLINKVYYKP